MPTKMNLPTMSASTMTSAKMHKRIMRHPMRFDLGSDGDSLCQALNIRRVRSRKNTDRMCEKCLQLADNLKGSVPERNNRILSASNCSFSIDAIQTRVLDAHARYFCSLAAVGTRNEQGGSSWKRRSLRYVWRARIFLYSRWRDRGCWRWDVENYPLRRAWRAADPRLQHCRSSGFRHSARPRCLRLRLQSFAEAWREPLGASGKQLHELLFFLHQVGTQFLNGNARLGGDFGNSALINVPLKSLPAVNGGTSYAKPAGQLRFAKRRLLGMAIGGEGMNALHGR